MGKKLAILATCGLLTLAFGAPPALAQSRGDQANARQEMQAGNAMSIREIERRIIPQMHGDEYIGFEPVVYYGVAQAYRLKFIHNGRVIWVDVDAKTAKILRISR